MISLISVPSLASISHCYQINFLKFFFFFFFNLFRSFRTTAELSRKHRVPCPPCPRHARLPLHQCTPQWFTCYSQRTSTESVVPSPWFTLGGHLWHWTAYEFGQMCNCAVRQNSLSPLENSFVFCAFCPSLRPTPEAAHLLIFSLVLWFLECHIVGLIHYIAFSHCLHFVIFI